MGEDRKKSEKELHEWLESIDFIDEEGAVVKPLLVPDESEDPEGDRGTE